MTDPDTVLRDALALHRGGDLSAARGLYGLVLMLRPTDTQALHLLGLATAAMGEVGPATTLIARAVALRPDFPAAWADLSTLLLGQQRFAEAGDAFEAALSGPVGRPGVSHDDRDRQPDLLNGRFGDPAGRSPAPLDQRDLLLKLALCRQLQGRLADAIEVSDRLLALDPAYLPGLALRGLMLVTVGRFAAAVTDLDVVLSLLPDHTDSLAARGGALWMLDDQQAAIRDLDRALALDPNHGTALINRANVYQDELRYDAALALCDRALSQRPADAAALAGRGTILQAMGQLDDALDSYRRSVALRPDHPDTLFNIALCLMQMGRWPEGWAAYEVRFQRQPWLGALPGFTGAMWDGQTDIRGKRVLLVGEQGLGDTIQFCRYARLLAQRGVTVILGVEPPLRRLMMTVAGVTAVVTSADPEPGYNLFCPLMSLPARLGLKEPTFDGPYLRADADAVAGWRERLAALPGLKIGLVWAGASNTKDHTGQRMDRRRSVPSDRLQPLLAVPGVTFVSLQKGAPCPHGIVDWTNDLDDFADTAALIEALDLVIGVDTSVVHAAGALGKPVWVMNRFDRCWRWMSGRTDTPWYATMRLFTQPAPGAWDDVVAEIAAVLTSLTGGR